MKCIYLVAGIAIEDKCPPPGTTEAFYLMIHNVGSCKYTVRVKVLAAVS